MPYGEKLKMIKTERRLTNAAISQICDVPLATVTRLFDEKSLSGNFETFVSIAKGLNISLDELAGLKPPSNTSNSELLADKDRKIERLLEDNQLLLDDNKRLREDNTTLREDSKSLREDNKTLRREKIKVIGVLVFLLIAIATWLIVDLVNGHFGAFRY